MDDDVPEIQLATGPHGCPTNPHVVSSATALRCGECGEDLAAAWLSRACAALVRTKEANV